MRKKIQYNKLSTKKIEEFESALANYVGAKHAIFVNSGSSALLAVFLLLAKKRGYQNEIITPATCFPTNISAMIYTGFKPVLVDVDPATLLIDPTEVEKAITDKTYGILAVHAGGNVCDMDKLNKVAYEHRLVIIEDICDALGAKWNGLRLGSQNISITSFHDGHIISTEQGGAIFTNNNDDANTLKQLRGWGGMIDFDDERENRFPLPKDYMERYTYTEIGFNFFPTETQAMAGIEQLKKIEVFRRRREYNFNFLKKKFIQKGYWVVESYKPATPSWDGIMVLTPKEKPRHQIFNNLRRAGIDVRHILASNIKLHPAFRWLYGNFPNANEVARRGLFLPVHQKLKVADLNYIIKSL